MTNQTALTCGAATTTASPTPPSVTSYGTANNYEATAAGSLSVTPAAIRNGAG